MDSKGPHSTGEGHWLSGTGVRTLSSAGASGGGGATSTGLTVTVKSCATEAVSWRVSHGFRCIGRSAPEGSWPSSLQKFELPSVILEIVIRASWGELTPAVIVRPVPSLPPRLAELAGLRATRYAEDEDRFPQPSDLPEVQALSEYGFRPLAEAPTFRGLPAIWPVEHRCWVPDRLPRVFFRYCAGSRGEVAPWGQQDRVEHYDDYDRDAAECGVPPPPRYRLWLVRTPWPSIGVSAVLDLLRQVAGPQGGGRELTQTASEVLYLTEDEAWRRWSGLAADAARAWRELGRDGEDVAELCLRGLGPQQMSVLSGALTEVEALAWAEAVGASGDAAVVRITAWLAHGLPTPPPSDPRRVLATIEPEKAAAWLTEGLTLNDIGRLSSLSLQRAKQWRDAGFDSPAVESLLGADPTLSPTEADAFVGQDIPPEQRRRWVHNGFSAAEARGWMNLDVSSGQARVWRSLGHDPTSAAPLVATHGVLPPSVNVGWVGWAPTRPIGWVGYGSDPADRRYAVADPPGTRGNGADPGQERACSLGLAIGRLESSQPNNSGAARGCGGHLLVRRSRGSAPGPSAVCQIPEVVEPRAEGLSRGK